MLVEEARVLLFVKHTMVLSSFKRTRLARRRYRRAEECGVLPDNSVREKTNTDIKHR